jgi:Domain of unknown function (DUF4430)
VRLQVTVCYLAFVALLAAGCGSLPGGKGTATVWVTRDRGAHVVLVRHVPAGETAMQALERVAKVQTAYGGRYVEAVGGVSGSLSSQRDWFYFVNGIESDRGAADYTLHPGDVEWWDYRSWKNAMSVPVVVGAFPEPFLHGFDGKDRPAVVLGKGAGARALARVVHGRVASRAPAHANVLRLVDGPVRFTARDRPDGGVELVYSGDPLQLARHPSMYRFRYTVR